MSLSALKSATQTDLHPLWKVHLWVSGSPSSRSSSLLQDLGYVVLSLHAVVQGNMCHVTLGHGGVQGGARPNRVASPHVRQSSRSLQLSIPGHSSAPSISHKSMLGLAGLRTAPSALPLSSPSRLPSGPPLSDSRPRGMLLLQTTWLPPYTPDLVADPLGSLTHS